MGVASDLYCAFLRYDWVLVWVAEGGEEEGLKEKEMEVVGLVNWVMDRCYGSVC